jgi:hypothetical protein
VAARLAPRLFDHVSSQRSRLHADDRDLLVALTLARSTQPITVAIFSQLRTFGSNIDIIAPATFVSLIIPLTVLAGSVK